MTGLSFRSCFRLRQSGFHQIVSHERSHELDSIKLMTPLTTPIFDFHYFISALATPLTTPTPTPSLVKTNLKKPTEH